MIILIMVNKNSICISSLLSYSIMTSSLKKIGNDASVREQRGMRLVRKYFSIQVPFEGFSECIKLCPEISKNI